MIGNGLKGLVGQGMDGRRSLVSSVLRVYPTGSWTFIAPEGGLYEVVGWQPGTPALNTTPGTSGGFSLKRVPLAAGQKLTIAVGKAAAMNSSSGGTGANTTTTITFPDGSVMTPGTNGDVVKAGVAAASTAVGAAAPSQGNYLGGPQSDTAGIALAPGGVGPVSTNQTNGGDGQVIVARVR